jgi:hypothetical protein
MRGGEGMRGDGRDETSIINFITVSSMYIFSIQNFQSIRLFK